MGVGDPQEFLCPARALAYSSQVWAGVGGRGLRPPQLEVWNPVGSGWQGGRACAAAEKPGDRGLSGLRSLSRPPWVRRSLRTLLPRDPGPGVRVVRPLEPERDSGGRPPALPPACVAHHPAPLNPHPYPFCHQGPAGEDPCPFHAHFLLLLRDQLPGRAWRILELGRRTGPEARVTSRSGCPYPPWTQ